MKSLSALSLLTGLLAILLSSPLCAAEAPVSSAFTLRGLTPEAVPQNVMPIRRVLPLEEIARGAPGTGNLTLTGLFNTASFDFQVRGDEIMTAAAVELTYVPSPALLAVRSQLNVYLNGYLQQTLPVTEEQLGKESRARVILNPLLLQDENELTIEFIGHYQEVCEDLSNTTLWLTLDRQSALTVTLQPLRLANELSLFPVPFLDPGVAQHSHLPLVLGESPDYATVTAAAIFASYMGRLASWRGVSFDTYLDTLPAEEHFVIFATNEKRPPILKDLPPFEGPSLILTQAPYSSFAKMLIIAGRDSQELIGAVRSLTASGAMLSGESALFVSREELEPRRPYDAPRWVDTSRVTTFEELTSYDGQLTSRGYQPAPVTLALRLPPDLFMLDRSNVLMNLKYRYTRPDPHALSQLRFLINDTLVESYTLDPESDSSQFVERLPLIGNLLDLSATTAQIPAIALQRTNTLSFDFRYGITYDGGNPEQCRTTRLLPQQVEIDPASTLDFTDFYHFARLPDLALFIQSGFPFTRLADLSETYVQLPPDATQGQLSTLFNLMGRMGAITGLAATSVTVGDGTDREALSDKDLLIIGDTTGDFSALADEESLQAAMDEEKRSLMLPADPEGRRTLINARREGRQRATVINSGNLALMLGFQSPYAKERSVVAILNDGREGSGLLNARLGDPYALYEVTGAVAIFRESGIRGYDVGESYYTGNLPWYVRLWYFLQTRPFLLVLSTLLSALLIGSALYAGFRILASRRLGR